MKILGVNLGHDSSAALVIDGNIVADIAEERFTRIKHYAGLPVRSIEYCLNYAGITMDDLTAVAVPGGSANNLNNLFSLKGTRRLKASFKRELYESYTRLAHKSQDDLPVYIKTFPLPKNIPLVQIPHHVAHASSAFHTSGFTGDALILTIDGIGGGTSVGIWHGKSDGKIECLKQFNGAGSLGWFYSNVTEALGWWQGDGEGKTMGLAPYGKDHSLTDELMRFCPQYKDGTLIKPHEFGGASHWNESGAIQWHFKDASAIKNILKHHAKEDLAASAQWILEEQVQDILYSWMQKTGLKNVCCAGGVFLNVKLNQRILYSGKCENYHVFPNAGDSGLAAGAALHAYYQNASEYIPQKIDNIYWGPEWSNEEIERTLRLCNLKYEYTDDPSLIAAEHLHDGEIIGWYQGRMESGPRALGNRSILVNANKYENKNILNKRVKFREGFRPFCPSLLSEKKEDYLKNAKESPYMTISFDVTDKKADKIPAVVHKDGTLRPQTVVKNINPRFWSLINNFGIATGEYLLLNTSFNIMGEPIVLDPQHAIRCFFGSGIDSLIIGNFLVHKN